MKKIICGIAFIIWTLLCIYGTYWNTVDNAEVTFTSASTYEITYWNTGHTYEYLK